MQIFSTRRSLRFIGKFVLLLLLGMQVSFAFNAGFQFASQQTAEKSAAMPSCHGNANLDSSRSLCRLHCVTDGQSVAQYDIPLLPPSLKAAPTLALQAHHVKLRTAPCSKHNALFHDPPIHTRFCSLQI